MEYKELNKQFWGRHMWARGYFVASSGNDTVVGFNFDIDLSFLCKDREDKFKGKPYNDKDKCMSKKHDMCG